MKPNATPVAVSAKNAEPVTGRPAVSTATVNNAKSAARPHSRKPPWRKGKNRQVNTATTPDPASFTFRKRDVKGARTPYPAVKIRLRAEMQGVSS